MSKDTLQLPKTAFSMKASLPIKEPEILKRWEKIKIFDKLRKDSKGKNYYSLSGNFQNFDNARDTDEWALANKYVSIVPVKHDITSYDSIPELKLWNL